MIATASPRGDWVCVVYEKKWDLWSMPFFGNVVETAPNVDKLKIIYDHEVSLEFCLGMTQQEEIHVTNQRGEQAKYQDKMEFVTIEQYEKKQPRLCFREFYNQRKSNPDKDYDKVQCTRKKEKKQHTERNIGLCLALEKIGHGRYDKYASTIHEFATTNRLNLWRDMLGTWYGSRYGCSEWKIFWDALPGTQLSFLNLSYNLIDDEGFGIIAKALKGCDIGQLVLHGLGEDSQAVTDVGVGHITRALATCKIRELQIQVPIEDQTRLDECLKHIAEALSTQCHMEAIYLPYMPYGSEKLPYGYDKSLGVQKCNPPLDVMKLLDAATGGGVSFKRRAECFVHRKEGTYNGLENPYPADLPEEKNGIRYFPVGPRCRVHNNPTGDGVAWGHANEFLRWAMQQPYALPHVP